MFCHRAISASDASLHWENLKRTISKERAFQATVSIGELAAEDMLDFSGRSPNEIERVYVKLRDGMPMAAGIRKCLPNVDVCYIVSQIKQAQGFEMRYPQIYFWDGYDGYSSSTIWFADPVNATGVTASESLGFLRQHFRFDTALISHIVANTKGIIRMQTTLDDFKVNGFMNYAYLSTKLNRLGYLADGLELIPDFGDKIWGTLGEDYSTYDIQKDLSMLLGTKLGDVEIIKGTILHIIQVANSDKYRSDRRASWVTRNWISAVLTWYCEVGELSFDRIERDQTSTLLDNLYQRDFLEIEKRPWKSGYADVFSLTDDGVKYVSQVYLPILHDIGIPQKIQEHMNFLIYLRPKDIENTIADVIQA